MSALFIKELRGYFTGLTGYIYTSFVLIFAGIYVMALNLTQGYPQFEYVMESISFIFLLAVPILTMRAFAEEKRQKTDQLLYSLPIRLSSVVTAKYLAMLAVTLAPTLIMCAYPLILSAFGTVFLVNAYASILMFFLLGAALTSIGMFISALTENQVVSAVITLVAMLIVYFMSGLAAYVSGAAISSLIALCLLALACAAGAYILTKSALLAAGLGALGVGALYAAYTLNESAFSGLFPGIMSKLSLFDRFYEVSTGVLDLKSAVYFISVACVFWFMTVQALEKRRWN